ncbi:permease prefix domain 1-containing protein [Anaerotignum sp.]|uniref:permease prefix domain 1-containing protein n=1 Tax=Anaerotignum sp. TaxID=2039241 RepID=UPI0027B9296E|nr:permease prefix domain 1-containing protein [Anaerotignum sp.]
MTSCVQFRFDRRAIRQELLAHMEDLYEDLLSQDIDEEQAAQLTVDYMGDSMEVGKELNEIHNPVLGLDLAGDKVDVKTLRGCISWVGNHPGSQFWRYLPSADRTQNWECRLYHFASVGGTALWQRGTDRGNPIL